MGEGENEVRPRPGGQGGVQPGAGQEGRDEDVGMAEPM